jgi:hypothetical protein
LADFGIMPPMKYWEIIADKLSAAGWSSGYCSAVTRDGWRSSLTPVSKRIGLKSNMRHSAGAGKTALDYVIPTFQRNFGRTEKSVGLHLR